MPATALFTVMMRCTQLRVPQYNYVRLGRYKEWSDVRQMGQTQLLRVLSCSPELCAINSSTRSRRSDDDDDEVITILRRFLAAMVAGVAVSDQLKLGPQQQQSHRSVQLLM